MDEPLYIQKEFGATGATAPAWTSDSARRLTRAARLCALVPALALLWGAGCKKNVYDDPNEQGKLRRISQNLEEAYARMGMPPVRESESLADRLAKWDDFRTCTVRTYAARKRDADAKKREGRDRPSRHASIGDETVEECAVQSAVVNKDPTVCQRLETDYPSPLGPIGMPAVRCWDTRARVFGLPEECPVVWLPDDMPGRNPECLAMARRDASLCPFADSPGRCRALVSGNSASCGAGDAAPDCDLALAYWKDLIPAGFGPPLIEPDKAIGKDKLAEGERPLFVNVRVRSKDPSQGSLNVDGPAFATGISWPSNRARVAWTEDTSAFWGATLPVQAAQIGWRHGKPALKVAFVPGGAPAGARALEAPGPTAAATVVLVWADPSDFRRCQPGPQTKGELRWEAGSAQPGSLVTVSLQAEKLACSDDRELDVAAQMRLVILDVR
jgi:hypothetical protein